MNELTFLLFLLAVGALPITGILMRRAKDAKRWRRELSVYELRFPRGLDGAAVTAFIAGLSGLAADYTRRPFVVRAVMFETSATCDGIRHHLLVPRDAAGMVLANLRATLPGVVVTPDQEYRPALVGAAIELGLSNHRRPLRTGDPAVTSARILAQLQPLSGGERRILQWFVSPMGPPPVENGSSGSSPLHTFLTHLWDGFPSIRQESAEVTRAAIAKQSSPLFIAVPRVGVVAASSARASRLARQLLSPFRAVSGPGVHFYARRLLAPAVIQALHDHRPPVLTYPAVLNATELTALLGFPLGTVSLPGLRLAGSRQLAPASDIPAGGRIVATATFPGAERPLALSVSDSLRHLHVMGPTGVGKSTLMLSMITQDMQAGRGVVVIEPKGDLVADVLDRVPPERTGDVMVLDLGDTERPVGLNPLAGAHRAPDLATDQILSLFSKLYASSWGNRTADILRVSLRTLAAQPGTSLVDLPLLLTDPAYARRLVARTSDPILRGFWSWYNGLSEGERGAAIGPVMNKLRAWLLSPRLRNVLGQANPRFDLGRALAERKIILLPLSRGLIGGESAALVGSLVVSQLWNAVQGRASLPADQRPVTCAYIDEFQDYLNLPTDLAEILAQARGLGLSLTLAHQHLAQLPAGIREAVLANARSRVLFQLGGSDARTLAKDLAPHLTADDLMGLGAYEIIASLSTGARVAPPVTGRTLPPPPATGQAEAARTASREQYGTTRAEVEAAFQQRHESSSGRRHVGREVS